MVFFSSRGDASHLLETSSTSVAPISSGISREVAGWVRTLPFASLSLGSVPATAVKERATGTIFPWEFCFDTTRGCPVITGTGVRRKRLAGIKNLDVYALGLYVADVEARRELHGLFAGADATRLASDQRLFDELLKRDGIDKTIRIVITSAMVKRKSFLDAISERLAPPLQAACASDALDAFQHQFDTAKFHKGMEICFTWTTKGQLVTQVDGSQVGVLSSNPLRRALLDIYVGQDPASAGAKAAFGQGLAAIVA